MFVTAENAVFSFAHNRPIKVIVDSYLDVISKAKKHTSATDDAGQKYSH